MCIGIFGVFWYYVGMLCALLFITSSPDFPFTKIDHKFMVSGHSFLLNDRDFGSIETARRKQQHLYVPHQWYNLIRTVRQKILSLCV